MLLCSDDFECCVFPPAPFHPIYTIIKITSFVFVTLFRCVLNVEVWIQILIQCVWPSYTQSQNITHFATFPLWPLPKFTPPAHAPFNKSYQVCYALIGNYPSFKMITQYNLLFSFQRNIIDQSLVLLLCVPGMYFIEDGAFISTTTTKIIIYANIVCSNGAEICRWQNTW